MKIKRIIELFLIGIVVETNCLAQQVSKREAVQAAINTIRYEKNGAANRNVDTVFTKTNRNDTLLYEVVFDDGNIVFLSGNKACVPVLGIILVEDAYTNNERCVVDTGSVFVRGENIPDGLSDLLDDYERQVAYCFLHNISGNHNKLWQRLQRYDSTLLEYRLKVGPLLSTKWGQSESNDKGYYQPDYCAYNALVTENNCHNSFCNKCPAGCVAVAMGQIMKFWNHPDENPQQNLLFDWDNMPDALIRHDNNNYYVEETAVATLLRNCGKQAQMTYCISAYPPCASSADPDIACVALKMYGYNDAVILQRSSCPNWNSLLINNLNNGNPIFYCGWNSSGDEAHAFVCDGYKDRILSGGYKFHFNWGWNGRYDGWFVLDNLTPDDYDFSYNHKAIFNLYPTECFLNIIMECDKLFSSETMKEYAVSGIIRNSGYAYIISNNASVHLQAGNEILFTNGFFADQGSDFYAMIAPCSSIAMALDNNNENDMGENLPFDTFPAPKSWQTVATQSDDAALTVHPNPTDDLLHIELSGTEIATVALYDLQGRIIYSPNLSNLPSNSPINMRNIPAGVYVLRVTGADGREYHRKIVKK